MVVLLCNAPTDIAASLARTLVEERLAACVNLIQNVVSIYCWDGKLCEEPETTLVIKTPREHCGQIHARIRDIHPYSIIEILCIEVDVVNSDPAYVAWVRALVGEKP